MTLLSFLYSFLLISLYVGFITVLVSLFLNIICNFGNHFGVSFCKTTVTSNVVTVRGSTWHLPILVHMSPSSRVMSNAQPLAPQGSLRDIKLISLAKCFVKLLGTRICRCESLFLAALKVSKIRPEMYSVNLKSCKSSRFRPFSMSGFPISVRKRKNERIC